MIIYKVINQINNKIYIGKTVGSLGRRMRQHKHDANKHQFYHYAFYRAIRKYGWSNFKWEILERCENNVQLCNSEIFWIEHYRTYIGFEDCNGYNSTLGGEGQVGRPCTEETRERMKNAQLGKVQTAEHRKNIGEAQKGKIVSEETKEKIRRKQKGVPRPQTTGDNSPVAKLTEKDADKVKKMLLNGCSQRAIAREFNVSRYTITSIQKGLTWNHVIVEGFAPYVKDTLGENNVNAKVTIDVVKKVKLLLIEGKLMQKEIAKMLGISDHIVSRIKTGKTWKHVKI